MAIGERIQFFRKLRGMTQKYLGTQVGFPEKSADVRLAQYETGTRTPKADMTAALANILDVSPLALSVPDIDSYLGLMHTLFTLEDRYGLKAVSYTHLDVYKRQAKYCGLSEGECGSLREPRRLFRLAGDAHSLKMRCDRRSFRNCICFHSAAHRPGKSTGFSRP